MEKFVGGILFSEVNLKFIQRLLFSSSGRGEIVLGGYILGQVADLKYVSVYFFGFSDGGTISSEYLMSSG